MTNTNTFRQFARQLYIDGLLNLPCVRKHLKEYTPLNDIDKVYFELLGHVVDTVKAAKSTHVKSRRIELKKLREDAPLESLNTK